MNARRVLAAGPAASYRLILHEFHQQHLHHKSKVLKFIEHLSVVPEGQKKRECYPDYDSVSLPKNHISDTWMKKIGII